jgi:hypothetical protein
VARAAGRPADEVADATTRVAQEFFAIDRSSPTK